MRSFLKYKETLDEAERQETYMCPTGEESYEKEFRVKYKHIVKGKRIQILQQSFGLDPQTVTDQDYGPTFREYVNGKGWSDTMSYRTG